MIPFTAGQHSRHRSFRLRRCDSVSTNRRADWRWFNRLRCLSAGEFFDISGDPHTYTHTYTNTHSGCVTIRLSAHLTPKSESFQNSFGMPPLCPVSVLHCSAFHLSFMVIAIIHFCTWNIVCVTCESVWMEYKLCEMNQRNVRSVIWKRFNGFSSRSHEIMSTRRQVIRGRGRRAHGTQFIVKCLLARCRWIYDPRYILCTHVIARAKG